jgi:hypothetical protein
MFTRLRMVGKAFALVAVAVATMGVGPVPKGDGSFYAVINAQYSMRTGDYCTAYATTYNGTGPYDFEWGGPVWVGSNTGYASDRGTVVSAGSFTQELEVWDDLDQYFKAELPVLISAGGSPCVE